jgi:programmed cell death 8 (apoptosis-inducing factor)
MPQTQIQSVDLVGQQIKLNLRDCKSILVDHVIVAIGSKPNTDLGKNSDLEVDSKLGGFVVNAELEARRHLFVAGDVACFYDPKLGRRRVEHHDHAVVSGRLAGENMVGLKKPYTHQSMFWSDLGPRVGYEAIGVVDSSLPTVAVFAKRSEKDVPESSGIDKLEGTEDVGEVVAPKIVSATGGSQNSEQIANDDYGKGVIFYLRSDKIVGIVLWNVFNRIGTARKIIAENKSYDDLNEVAKLFDIHEQQS